MGLQLFEHQSKAVEKMKNGCILVGGVGSGKSLTGLAYYFMKECGGKVENNYYEPMKQPKDLYIITTARKRDSLEWEGELVPFLLSTTREMNSKNRNIQVIIDSWNNISKYKEVKDGFFIFDEQKVIGSGMWTRSFLKITKNNNWIVLSATPGDTWMDYITIFIANGFYKTRTEFLRRHVVYNNFSKFPKIDHYVEVGRLVRLRESIIVNMPFVKKTIIHKIPVVAEFDKELFDTIWKKRWNPYENRPVKDITELGYLLRRVANSDPSRRELVQYYLQQYPRLIIFYNFNYELELLLDLGKQLGVPTTQYNGHKHEDIPNTESWLYLVQYTAGQEAWNCIKTNAMILYSQSYSYKATVQAAGRIDRLTTPYTDLYYMYFTSESPIDLAIGKSLKGKQNFNERAFLSA